MAGRCCCGALSAAVCCEMGLLDRWGVPGCGMLRCENGRGPAVGTVMVFGAEAGGSKQRRGQDSGRVLPDWGVGMCEAWCASQGAAAVCGELGGSKCGRCKDVVCCALQRKRKKFVGDARGSEKIAKSGWRAELQAVVGKVRFLGWLRCLRCRRADSLGILRSELSSRVGRRSCISLWRWVIFGRYL